MGEQAEIASSLPRVSDLVDLGWCLRILISDMFPGDIDAASPEQWYALQTPYN
jgi:hypothetical protein